MHIPADCVKAICADRGLLRTLRAFMKTLKDEELVDAVARATSSQDTGSQENLGHHDAADHLG